MSEIIKEEIKAEPTEKVVPKKKPDLRKKLAKPEKMLILNSSPHLHTTKSVKSIMWSVIIALIPAIAMSIYYFGLPAVFDDYHVCCSRSNY